MHRILVPAEMTAGFQPELAGSWGSGARCRGFRLVAVSLWWYAFLCGFSQGFGKIWSTVEGRQTRGADAVPPWLWGAQWAVISAVSW